MTFDPPATPPSPFTPTAEDRTVRFTRRSLRTLSLLLFGVLVLSMLMVLTIAQRQNSASVEHDQLLMQQAWKNRQDAMITDIRDYAFWGEAWRNLHLTVNKVWAFDEENFGPGLYEEYHYEGVFVVDGQGRTTYTVIDGKLSDTSLEEWLGAESSRSMIAAARKLNNAALTQNALINHLPAIVVAAPISSGRVTDLPQKPGPVSVMVFVNLFTPAKLQALGTTLDVRAPRQASSEEDAAREPRMLQPVPNGEPIVLRWTPKMPGMGLVWFLLPLLTLMAIIIGLITRRVSRHALYNAILSDRRFAMLAISQQELASSEARFRDLAEAASDWIWETDEEGRLIYLSARFHVVTGHEIAHWLGRHIDHLLTHPSHSLVAWLLRQEQEPQQMPLRCQFMSAHGERRIGQLVAKTIWHDARRIGFRGTVSDITQGMEAEARIQFLSRHDGLTGLSNRVQLQEFLTLHLEQPDAAPLTLITLDLDQFRPINDTWGHAAGDEVLSQMAQRLKRCIGPQELVARLGGDEFVLVLREANRERVDQRCAQLVHEIQQPISTGHHVHYLTISMGIACAPQDALHADALLRMADIALNEAREAGRNQWIWYANEMASQRDDKREMSRRIEKALKNNEFRLHYQPRYQLLSGQLAGAEALIHWQIAPDQWITPDRFIPLAEESGLIATISDWVLMRACEDALGWGGDRYVSVNISPMEFRTSDLVQRVANALATSGLPATRLELEITENVTFEHPQHALEVMQGLRSLGVRLTVDDFGTGYAALGYLKTFPFNGLKIDRSWMKDFPESQQAQSVVAGIIALARAFALTITAEGIETEAQLNQLKQLSCEEGQGYFLGRPMPLAAFSTLLERTAQNPAERT